VEWQYRMNKEGWSSVILPGCRVLHNHHSSTSKLGVMFIHYHEFRSRIIFSAVRYNFPFSIVRRILTLWAICFRMFYYSVLNFKSFRISANRFHLYGDLIKMTLSSKRKVLSSRFIYQNYIKYFLDNDNAKL
jgi:GT2 family glycosyltransferase